jgi:hypothetical protein
LPRDLRAGVGEVDEEHIGIPGENQHIVRVGTVLI